MAEAKSEQLLNNLSLLLEMNSILNSTVGMDQVLQSIARGLVDVFGYGGSLVFEYQEDEGPVLSIKAFAYKYGSEIIDRIEKLLGFPLVGYQFRPETGRTFHRLYSEHRALLSNNVTVLVAGLLHSTGKKKLAPVITRLLKIKSIIVYPLVVKESTRGVLVVAAQKQMGREDLELVRTFADQAAVALENARYYESIRLSEERFSHIAENIGDWVWEVDQEGRYTYCNSVVTSILGYTPEEMMGKALYDFASKPEYEKIRNWAERIPEKPETFNNVVTRQLHRQGNIIILKNSGAPLLDASGNVIGCRGVSQNITRELELEEQLRQAQKLESIGTLAGGIAHDFNNILGGILGYASLLKEELPTGSDLLPEVETIITSVKRAAELTRQLLAFARKGHYQLVPVDPNNIVNEVVKLLSRTIEKAVVVETSLSPSLGAVMGDSGQINQMLLNLCLNGCDAMPAGGRLLIKTENIVIDNTGNEALPELERGSYVKLTVSDTGVGIEPEIQKRIFDPFFTTKERAGGEKHSGLGLAMVFGIVKSHDGAVKLESEKGEGSTFFIYLPCTEKNAQRGKEKKKRVPGGSETILVVDDESEGTDFQRLQ